MIGNGNNRNAGNIYGIADDFTLGTNTTVTGVTFAFGFTNSDVTQALLDIGLYDSSMNNLFLQQNVSVTGTQIATTGGYRIYEATISGLNVNLGAGDYWFAFNGVNSAGSYSDWGISTPSGNLRQSRDNMLFDTFLSYQREQQFSILGNSIAAVPLPAGGMLLIGALGGLGLMRRRRSV
ncbi:hypothetical protein RSK20926_22339 [Roseobacter sp. SK209-2-6]|uniref:VPLPA-CTERM sorting domain-containing protein n=1 Tax=Roseobacter sp. SK209-2-6 TaxID=388739 RepID=UPI0000F3F20A|nr:VPLPA-CTERM sorting domain-containing protein [Roseobacter sp. SK209-2-6]EBA16511.1 hypothetical protein RSK20926_22339 [Roseobacter sp. SK209-2-6]